MYKVRGFQVSLRVAQLLGELCPNPQYWIIITDPDDEDNLCTVIVLLMQKGGRAMRDEGMGCLTIGIAIIFQLAPKFFKAS